MLVLSRKRGESICIGDEITVRVISVYGNRVKIGIDAPSGYRILRAELSEWVDEAAGDSGVGNADLASA